MSVPAAKGASLEHDLRLLERYAMNQLSAGEVRELLSRAEAEPEFARLREAFRPFDAEEKRAFVRRGQALVKTPAVRWRRPALLAVTSAALATLVVALLRPAAFELQQEMPRYTLEFQGLAATVRGAPKVSSELQASAPPQNARERPQLTFVAGAPPVVILRPEQRSNVDVRTAVSVSWMGQDGSPGPFRVQPFTVERAATGALRLQLPPFEPSPGRGEVKSGEVKSGEVKSGEVTSGRLRIEISAADELGSVPGATHEKPSQSFEYAFQIVE